MVGKTRHATAFLGLGSNLGDRLTLMRAAVAAIDAASGVHVDCFAGVASLFETTPIGAVGPQSNFFNSAVRVATTLDPNELLHELQTIETSLGRNRPTGGAGMARVGVGRSRDSDEVDRGACSVDTRPHHWEARTIDIDLLLYDNLTCGDDELTLPHPRMHLRRFVLDPLSEIAGDRIHPIEGVTIKSLLRNLASHGDCGAVVRIAGPKWFKFCPYWLSANVR
jgi:2-amino-4-hydroxy-6-hydroxymethyldihydropteridine diphosphokinase